MGVVESQIISTQPDQQIVGLAAGLQAGISPDDVFCVLSESGVVGCGTVYFATQDKCVGRWVGPTVAPGQSVVIVRHEAMVALRDQLPPGATVAGRIARVAPGRRTAWVDLGSASGLREGDQLLVSRKGIPISRGRISNLQDDAALTTLEPLVSNTLPEPGDRVELWPAPSDAHWGRLNSTVLKVTSRPADSLEGDEIVIPGTAADGIAVDRLVDVYRGRQYVGMARVVDVSSPLSRATMVDVATVPEGFVPGKTPAKDASAARMHPQEGDRAIVRASPELPAGPLTVAVFNIADDYCLIAAGELDGVQMGEQFLVRRQDAGDSSIWHDVAMLKIEHLEPLDSGARIKPLTSQVEGVRLWDMAERQLAGGEAWRPAGIVDSVDERTRTASASIEPNTPVAVGDVVCFVPDKDTPPSGAVVIRKGTDHLVLLVPPGWGELSAIARARVDVRQQASGKSLH